MRINMLIDNQIVRTRRYKHARLVAMPPWALQAVGNPGLNKGRYDLSCESLTLVAEWTLDACGVTIFT